MGAQSGLTNKEFRNLLWKRGERIVYHIGNLMFDREENHDVELIGRSAWEAHLEGRAVLVQERVKPGVCRYIAVVV